MCLNPLRCICAQAITRGQKSEEQWKADCAEYAKKYPKEFAEFTALTSGKLPAGWESSLPAFKPEDKALATRQHSQVRWCLLLGT